MYAPTCQICKAKTSCCRAQAAFPWWCCHSSSSVEHCRDKSLARKLQPMLNGTKNVCLKPPKKLSFNYLGIEARYPAFRLQRAGFSPLSRPVALVSTSRHTIGPCALKEKRAPDVIGQTAQSQYPRIEISNRTGDEAYGRISGGCQDSYLRGCFKMEYHLVLRQCSAWCWRSVRFWNLAGRAMCGCRAAKWRLPTIFMLHTHRIFPFLRHSKLG